MLELTKSAILCGTLAAMVSATDIPNPRYEAAVRRVSKKCDHLDAGRVQSIRDAVQKMHAEGATRNAARKACRELVSEWSLDFKDCANAVVAVAYIPKTVPKPPPPAQPPNISPLVQDIIKRGHAVKKAALRSAKRDRRERKKGIFGGSPSGVIDYTNAIKKNAHPLPALRLEQGSVGALADHRGLLRYVTVFQVVDSTNAIIDFRGGGYSYRPSPVGGPGHQVFVPPTRAWLAGVSTAGLVDGDSYEFHENLRCAGTKQYSTAIGGTLTIHKLERVKLTGDERKALGFPAIAPPPAHGKTP